MQLVHQQELWKEWRGIHAHPDTLSVVEQPAYVSLMESGPALSHLVKVRASDSPVVPGGAGLITVLHCYTAQQCPSLFNPPNGRVNAPTRTVGSRATYSCNPGYTLIGPSTLVCQAGGMWSGSAPTCRGN